MEPSLCGAELPETRQAPGCTGTSLKTRQERYDKDTGHLSCFQRLMKGNGKVVPALHKLSTTS
jgi:hypothetical protein